MRARLSHNAVAGMVALAAMLLMPPYIARAENYPGRCG